MSKRSDRNARRKREPKTSSPVAETDQEAPATSYIGISYKNLAIGLVALEPLQVQSMASVMAAVSLRHWASLR